MKKTIKELEARTIIENTGNYDECEIDDVLDVYKNVMKHVGFRDERRDSRFIVKFHDIFYYTPDEYYNEHADELNALFEEFCEMEYEYIMDEINTVGIDLDKMFAQYDVGHYKAFDINIDEITEENAAEIAMQIYDEHPYTADRYMDDRAYLVNLLQDLEDNYMEYWIEFLKNTPDISQDLITQTEDAYNARKQQLNKEK